MSSAFRSYYLLKKHEINVDFQFSECIYLVDHLVSRTLHGGGESWGPHDGSCRSVRRNGKVVAKNAETFGVSHV